MLLGQADEDYVDDVLIKEVSSSDWGNDHSEKCETCAKILQDKDIH